MKSEDAPHAKLTADQVLQIRDLRAQGVTPKEIAARFNVSESNITMIVNRRTWKHI